MLFRSKPRMRSSFLPTILVLTALGLHPARSQAQVSELGITGGVTYYIGDLNTRHYYNPKPAIGLVYRYNFNERYAFRLQGLYGRLAAFDSDSHDPNAVARNLSFTTSLFEVAGLLEVNFFPYRAGKDKKNWTPFLFVGAAYFRTNPKAELNGVEFDLAPLGTEGQGSSAGTNEPYALDHLAYPFGAGMKFNMRRVDIQLEWGLRKTKTDYIDDVSGNYVDNSLLEFENGDLSAALADRSDVDRTNGDPNAGRARGDDHTSDWYQYTGVSLTILLGGAFTECDELYKSMRERRR
ncbi:MAG: DUF6089 family protein [Flavobacteriales bacterium]